MLEQLRWEIATEKVTFNCINTCFLLPVFPDICSTCNKNFCQADGRDFCMDGVCIKGMQQGSKDTVKVK